MQNPCTALGRDGLHVPTCQLPSPATARGLRWSKGGAAHKLQVTKPCIPPYPVHANTCPKRSV